MKLRRTAAKKKIFRKGLRGKIISRTAKLRLRHPRALRLVRNAANPIILPKKANGWESWQTFNPGVIGLNERVHFLYRAIGEEGISRLGYASSPDGFHIDHRLDKPVYESDYTGRNGFQVFSLFSGGSWGGVEDPRLVKIKGEDRIYMTYTVCGEGLRVALTSIKASDFLAERWEFQKPQLISKPGEVHKNWVIFPEKINGRYAILHSISPKISIAYRDSLEFEDGDYIESYYDGSFRQKKCWDNWLRGAGAPPLRTKYGWLLFYHAMDEQDPGKYKVGVFLLDLADPTRVLKRSVNPVLEPDEDYENNGFKSGVVYVSGAVIRKGELLVYYGAADSYVSVARARLDEFLKKLIVGGRPLLKVKVLKRK